MKQLPGCERGRGQATSETLLLYLGLSQQRAGEVAAARATYQQAVQEVHRDHVSSLAAERTRNPAALDHGNRVAGNPSGKFPGQAGGLNQGIRGKGCQRCTVAGE